MSDSRVLLVYDRDDRFAHDAIVDELVAAIGARRCVVEPVEGARQARMAIQVAARAGVVMVVCASDSATAATLIWELAGVRELSGRLLVVLGDVTRLETLPRRLRDAFEFIALGERGIDGVLSRIEKLSHAPRPVDLLASVYRSAIARRSPDALLAVGAMTGPVVESDAPALSITAQVGDGGPQPNPLWSHWVGHGRTLKLVEPSAQRGNLVSKKQPPQRKQ